MATASGEQVRPTRQDLPRRGHRGLSVSGASGSWLSLGLLTGYFCNRTFVSAALDHELLLPTHDDTTTAARSTALLSLRGYRGTMVPRSAQDRVTLPPRTPRATTLSHLRQRWADASAHREIIQESLSHLRLRFSPDPPSAMRQQLPTTRMIVRFTVPPTCVYGSDFTRSTSASKAPGFARVSRLATLRGSSPKRMRLTGTSSFLPLSVRGTAAMARI